MEKLKRILNDDELSVGDPNDRKITPDAGSQAFRVCRQKLEERKQRPS
jgi:hypothetical protein